MTLKKAKEIMTNISVEKATYFNTLEYESQQMKEKDEIKAIEVVMGTLAVYEMTV